MYAPTCDTVFGGKKKIKINSPGWKWAVLPKMLHVMLDLLIWPQKVSIGHSNVSATHPGVKLVIDRGTAGKDTEIHRNS